jgi:hypothetical protein
VFTHTLLEGLRGGAADPLTGNVTSSRLRNYLTNHMRNHLTEEDREDGMISQEPDFGFDDDLVFCTVPVTRTAVTLEGFPAGADGKPFTILSGSPLAEVAQGVVQQGRAVVPLPPQLHFLQMTSPVFAKGFQVPGGNSVTIDLRA